MSGDGARPDEPSVAPSGGAEDEARPRDTLDDPVPAAAPDGPPRGARAAQLGAWLLLCASAGVVGVTAAPAVAREMGVTEVRVVTRDFARAAPAGQAGVDAVRDFEKGIGRSVAELESDDDALDYHADPRGLSPQPAGSAKLAISSRDLVLRELPKKSAREAGTVRKGEALVVLRRERGWVLVVHQAERGDGIEVGWVPERDVGMP